MKTSDMTQEQKNKFWHLFLQYTWLENNFNYDFYRDLSGFEKVWKYMEKEYPELWNSYLKNADRFIDKIEGKPSDVFNYIMNLNNLLTFLIENKEKWEEIECPHQNTKSCNFECNNSCGQNSEEVWITKHPALQYLESEGL